MFIRWLTCAIAMLALLGAAPAVAAVRPGDASATHAYLLAKLRLQREGTGSGEAGLDAVRGLAEQLHTECPGILTGTPLAGPEEAPDRVDSELSKEIADDALNADETLNRLPDTRFYATVKRLRWSNRKLTRLLHDLALESVRLSEIPAPDICADIRYWVASGYSGLSAGTIRVVHEDDVANSTATIEVEPKEKEGLFDSEEVVRHRLRRYENRSDRRLDVRAFPFKKLIGNPKFEAALATYFRAVEQVFSSLGKSGLELPIS